ncbi:MAG TPA: phosphate signaling complex protein PhoU [Terriglobia bacterium]|nr:phosphate signaling complex protein PhoU [Terriglobia bacterium]
MRHFEERLNELRLKLLEMGGLVESAVHSSVQALIEANVEMAKRVLADEPRINQLEIENDDLATGLLALEAPVASDLRFITAAIKINNNLERMGDKAANIAERSIALASEPAVTSLVDIARLGRLVEPMVHQALDAFVRRDSALARAVLTSDDAVDDMRNHISAEVIQRLEEEPRNAKPWLDLLFIGRSLERIGDHATNIAEDVVFMVDGVDVRHGHQPSPPASGG